MRDLLAYAVAAAMAVGTGSVYAQTTPGGGDPSEVNAGTPASSAAKQEAERQSGQPQPIRVQNDAAQSQQSQGTQVPGQSRAALGVYFDDQTSDGIVINRVQPGSPAARMGFQPGDRIRSFNGREYQDYRTFSNEIGGSPFDQDSEFIVTRDGQEMNINGRLGQWDTVYAPQGGAYTTGRVDYGSESAQTYRNQQGSYAQPYHNGQTFHDGQQYGRAYHGQSYYGQGTHRSMYHGQAYHQPMHHGYQATYGYHDGGYVGGACYDCDSKKHRKKFKKRHKKDHCDYGYGYGYGGGYHYDGGYRHW